MLTLGLDPGGTTGYAVVTEAGVVVEAGSFGWEEWAILERLLTLPLTGVVIERFALYGHKAGALVGSEMEAAQVIGAVRYALAQPNRNAEVTTLTPRLHFQPASSIHDGARRLSPYARRLVEAAGADGVDRHAKDALAHALVYLSKQKKEGLR